MLIGDVDKSPRENFGRNPVKIWKKMGISHWDPGFQCDNGMYTTISLGFQPPLYKTMGVNITTIAYLRVLIIEIGSTNFLMVVEAQGSIDLKKHSMIQVQTFQSKRCGTSVYNKWGTKNQLAFKTKIKHFPWGCGGSLVRTDPALLDLNPENYRKASKVAGAHTLWT